MTIVAHVQRSSLQGKQASEGKEVLIAKGVGLIVEVGVPGRFDARPTINVADGLEGRNTTAVLDEVEGMKTVAVLDGEA
jgi:hypothetical protein